MVIIVCIVFVPCAALLGAPGPHPLSVAGGGLRTIQEQALKRPLDLAFTQLHDIVAIAAVYVLFFPPLA